MIFKALQFELIQILVSFPGVENPKNPGIQPIYNSLTVYDRRFQNPHFSQKNIVMKIVEMMLATDICDLF